MIKTEADGKLAFSCSYHEIADIPNGLQEPVWPHTASDKVEVE